MNIRIKYLFLLLKNNNNKLYRCMHVCVYFICIFLVFSLLILLFFTFFFHISKIQIFRIFTMIRTHSVGEENFVI